MHCVTSKRYFTLVIAVVLVKTTAIHLMPSSAKYAVQSYLGLGKNIGITLRINNSIASHCDVDIFAILGRSLFFSCKYAKEKSVVVNAKTPARPQDLNNSQV